MIHLRFNNNAIFFIMEIKFNIYRVNFIFTIDNKMPIKTTWAMSSNCFVSPSIVYTGVNCSRTSFNFCGVFILILFK